MVCSASFRFARFVVDSCVTFTRVRKKYVRLNVHVERIHIFINIVANTEIKYLQVIIQQCH